MGYAAAAVVVAGLVTGLVTVGIPTLVGSHAARATCDIFRTENNCTASGGGPPLAHQVLPTFTLTTTLPASPSWTPKKGQIPPPTVEELIGDCDGTAYLPDGQTTGNTMNLDGCTYEEESAWDDMQWKDLDWASNCGSHYGPTPLPMDQALSGSTTWTNSFTIGADLGLNLGNLKQPWGGLHLNPSYSYSYSSTITRTTTIHIQPGHKGAITAGQAMHHSRGRIRVNYSNNRLGGHYIWYINYVAIDTPIPGKDKQKDGMDTNQDTGSEDKACGGPDSLLLHEKDPPYGFTPWPPHE